MAMIQDCFKIPSELIERVVKLAKKKTGSGGKSALYRMAIIEYLDKYETEKK
jgi:hypothetical protein